MNKYQALHSFWSGFGLKAYDETSVPDYVAVNGVNVKLEPPYITYETSGGNFDHTLYQTASLWYRSDFWTDVQAKEQQIADFIGRGGRIIKYTGGGLWIRMGSPWMQRMAEPSDDTIRRIVLNVIVEFMD